MRVAVTGATGLVGTRVVAALKARGDEVTALSRNPERAGEKLGIEAVAWDPKAGPAPPSALAGRDAVVHLSGEAIDQRWTKAAKEEIRASREVGTRNLVAGLAAAEPRPAALVSASGSGFYGPHGAELVDESSPAGRDWVADICVRWEKEADAAAELGVRVVKVRTGPVLDSGGGALKRMLLPFRLGLGGPVAGGEQYFPWIHREDIAGIYLAALDNERFSGAVNAASPEPATNKDFSRALGRALRRPAVAPVPGFAVKLLFGEMSQIVVTGVRMVPGRAGELGYDFAHPELDEALADALDR